MEMILLKLTIELKLLIVVCMFRYMDLALVDAGVYLLLIVLTC